MKSLLILGCLLLASEGLHAQFSRGYIFIAPTITNGPSAAANTSFGILPPPTPLVSSTAVGNNSYSAGGGLEQVFSNYLGAGLDLTAILPGQGKVFHNALGVVSPSLYLHSSASGKTDVFAVTGYSLIFRDFTANGINFGGGVNYWFHENLAARGSSRPLGQNM